jgi:hypothetical protein
MILHRGLTRRMNSEMADFLPSLAVCRLALPTSQIYAAKQCFLNCPTRQNGCKLSAVTFRSVATPSVDCAAVLNGEVVGIPRRPTGMGLRDYVGPLAWMTDLIGSISNVVLSNDFLAIREHALFGPDHLADPSRLSETRLRSQIRLFAANV